MAEREVSKGRLRLFVALDLPDEVKERIGAAVERQRSRHPEARWVKPDNLHLTLKFIGEYPEEGLERLEKALREAAEKYSPFTMALKGCGGFPSSGKSRVIWVGMDRGEREAAGLAAVIESRLEKVGVKREKRSFRGHLTVARLKDPRNCSSWLASLEGDLGDLEEMPFQVREITLYRSILSPGGPTYIPLERIPLGREDEKD